MAALVTFRFGRFRADSDILVFIISSLEFLNVSFCYTAFIFICPGPYCCYCQLTVNTFCFSTEILRLARLNIRNYILLSYFVIQHKIFLNLVVLPFRLNFEDRPVKVKLKTPYLLLGVHIVIIVERKCLSIISKLDLEAKSSIRIPHLAT